MTGPVPAPVDVVVVGAGLAGLAAATEVHRAGRSVVVLDASDGVGGRVRTDRVDGFALDRGFQVVLTAYPDLERQLDVPALDLRRFDPGALVWTGDRLHRVADPLRMPRALPGSIRAPIGSPVDKARLALLQMRLRRADPRDLLRRPDVATIDALRAEGFGETIIERFFRPLVGGIQLDPDLTASRRMFDVVLRCLTVGDAAVPSQGMQAIPDQLAAGLPGELLGLGRRVVAVGPGRVTTSDGATIDAGRVVVATDGPTASRLLERREEVGSRAAACVWFAADAPPVADRLIALDGTGRGPALNVAMMTNVAPAYSPDGRALIAAACPGVTTQEGLEDAVRRQLGSWWGPPVRAWRHLRTDWIPHAQPDSRPPFSPKRSVVAGDGIFVCGDHRDTPSIQGALHSGRRCGEAVVSSLT